MAISRQTNFLGQMRVDTPHLKAIESAVANDFDLLAGKMLSGKAPLIIKGFTVGTANTIGTPVENLQLNVAGALLMHYNASEAGTVFGIADNAPAQTLNGLNANITGSFTAGVTNYVGIDLFRAADTATSDLVQFYDANTEQEVPQTVPLARTLQYKIIISTQNFTVSSNIVPIAKIVTSTSNTVTSITDARKLMFRLGSGGDNPSATSAYSWGTRLENAITFTGSGGDSFSGEDKSLGDLKSWLDMAMTVMWEAKGGETWFSPVNRDNVKLANGQPVLATGDNFFFPLYTVVAGDAARVGTTVTVQAIAHQFIVGQVIDVGSAVTDPDFPIGTKVVTAIATDEFEYEEVGAAVSNAETLKISSLMWSGLSLVFENSSAWSNPVVASALTGVAIPDGGCLYVDLVRENDSAINAVVAPLLSVGYSVIPGRRMILAWRSGDYMYAKDRPFEIGRFLNPVATNLALGIVKLNNVAEFPAAPVVVSITTGGGAAISATSGNTDALTLLGIGVGRGLVVGSGSGATGDAIYAVSNATDGSGILAYGAGAGHGGMFIAGSTGNAIQTVVPGTGFGYSGAAISAIGDATYDAILGTASLGGVSANAGLFGRGHSSLTMIGLSGDGVRGAGYLTGSGGNFRGGATNAPGIYSIGGGTGGYGGDFLGGSATGIGVNAQGGGTGSGGQFTGGAGGGKGLVTVGTSNFAIEVGSGHAQFTGAAPAKTDAHTDTVTPINILKAWGSVPPADLTKYDDGFNLFSIPAYNSPTLPDVTITLGTAMANAFFHVDIQVINATGLGAQLISRTAAGGSGGRATFTFRFVVISTGAYAGDSSIGYSFCFSVYGRQ